MRWRLPTAAEVDRQWAEREQRRAQRERDRDEKYRAKEDRAYSRWLDLRRRGPRGWLITANVATILAGVTVFGVGAAGWGRYGYSLAAAATVGAILLGRASTSDELMITAMILAALAALAYASPLIWMLATAIL
jgi:hypothetical protein